MLTHVQLLLFMVTQHTNSRLNLIIQTDEKCIDFLGKYADYRNGNNKNCSNNNLIL